MKPILICAVATLALAACKSTELETPHGAAPTVDYAAALADSRRPAADVERDAARNPAEVLSFAGIGPGDAVVDLGAGGGYMTRLLAAVVGDDGSVIMQNPPEWVEKFESVGPAMQATAAGYPNVTPSESSFGDLGYAPGSLDAAFAGLIYHDTANLPVDRVDMNRQIFAALKPGGVYVVTDHRAEADSGVRDTDTLHRIDAATVLAEATEAGFQLDAEGDFLANPDDPLTISVFDPSIRGSTNRFALRFVKPAG